MSLKSAVCLLSLVVCAGPLLAAEPAKKDKPQWKPLFNGEDLDGWKSTAFGGEGEVEVKDGAIILNPGTDMTGVTYTGKLPKTNYELVVEAQRLEGLDFFAATTFPVGDSHASFIPGGWAGGVTGISSINGLDASENETTKYRPYKDKTWYAFRIRVTDDRLLVWVDDKLEVDVERKDKKFSTRGEVDLSKPLGIATWNTKGAIRTVKVRELSEAEIKATKEIK